MLDTDTKRRIDTARDILVGKVPDPKSQVEQITIALIYKFMDDMDAESEEFGGKRKFFAAEFARYGWAKLMRSGLGGHETLNLYAEAITRMPENPGIPLLFREIFKNAYLPYRDPETLRAFLKIIDEFVYDHSERLGDAFEYLLSVLGSQGEAGQFRTPRHIIDFIVDIVDPKKDESVLDPACGTAGFLISSYKHIIRSNTDKQGHNTLTPDEKGRLAQNFKGYDISPDMVRLSLVNMYLHGFTDPHIYEYDTLTSQDRWNEYADVILANPPFMSPTGGIRPHNRFSVQSKRSEVLFVDYMAEHLTPSGRAGIIVPEGIIFQSQAAYRRLRKMLVEEYLVAVVSLPAGVFNPYSGVKTSILILDRLAAKKSDAIFFIKIKSDGTDLGTRRRETETSDLPGAKVQIAKYLQTIREEKAITQFEPLVGFIVKKDRVAAQGDYNLSGERYQEDIVYLSEFHSVGIGAIFERSGKEKANDRLLPIMSITMKDGLIDQSQKFKKRIASEDISSYKVVFKDELVVGFPIDEGVIGFLTQYEMAAVSPAYGIWRIRPDMKDVVDTSFLEMVLRSSRAIRVYKSKMQGAVSRRRSIPTDIFVDIQIPLPPLEEQKKIVAEIEGYKKVIDGARAVVENYRPHISIDPEWPTVALENLVANKPYSMKAGPFGSALKKEYYVSSGYKIYGQEQVIRGDAKYGDYYVNEEKYQELESCKVLAGDVLISLVGTYGKVLIVPENHEPGIINPRLVKLTLNQKKMIPTFFALAFLQDFVMAQVHGMSYGGTMGILSLKVLKNLLLPLPPLSDQEVIVAQIEAEQALIAGNRELIERFEKKIQAALGRVWGEDNEQDV